MPQKYIIFCISANLSQISTLNFQIISYMYGFQHPLCVNFPLSEKKTLLKEKINYT